MKTLKTFNLRGIVSFLLALTAGYGSNAMAQGAQEDPLYFTHDFEDKSL